MYKGVLSILGISVLGTCAFWGTLAFSYALQAENPWGLAVATLFGAGVVAGICCLVGWIIVWISGVHFESSTNIIDYLLLSPAVCLIVFSAVFAAIGVSIFFTSELGKGIAAATLGGLISGVILLMLICIICVVLSYCNINIGIFGNYIDNHHFLSNSVPFDNILPPTDFNEMAL